MRSSSVLPPLPVEHGARSLLVVALLTPVSVSFTTGIDWSVTRVVSYLLVAILAVGTMLVRESIRRYRMADRAMRRRFLGFALVEASVILGVVVGLVALRGPSWIVAVGVFPGVAFELRFRKQGQAGGFRDVLAGVLALSLLVPIGVSLLGITSLTTLLLLYVLFAGYHVLAIDRVLIVLDREESGDPRSLARWMAGPLLALVAVLLGWGFGWVSVAGPALFTVSTLRTLRLARASPLPTTKRLGQGEAGLSFLFVLGGFWLLP